MFYSGKSDVGLRRSVNQDCFDLSPLPGGYLLATVCDGVGGANGGNIASTLACETYTEYIRRRFSPDPADRTEMMSCAADEANRAVFERAGSDEELYGMGTTLVSALISPDGKADIINIGDSKLFKVSPDGISQITHDHSYVQYLVDMGQLTVKEAQTSSIRNIITRSVGNEEEVSADLFTDSLDSDSAFLLCSDGLTDCVPSEEITSVVNDCRNDLQSAVDKLISAANRGGGDDNITVVLIRL